MKHFRVHVTLLLVASMIAFSAACMAQREDGPVRRWLMEKRSERQTQSESRASADLMPRTLFFGGNERTYYLYTPPASSDRPLPMVLVFHGGHANAQRMASITGLHELAKRENFIVVYPEAVRTNRVWNDGRSTTASHVDDVAFVSALISHLENATNVDPNRIYATGASNGGMFTLRLACELADRIAAFAPVVANLPVDLKPRCRPARPLPILLIHGTEDSMMPWRGGQVAGSPLLGRGGGAVVSASDTVTFWTESNGCSLQPRVSNLPDVDPNDGTRVKRVHYAACRGDSEVISVIVQGGGHTWPGTSEQPRLRRSGVTSRDIDASKIIWQFFQQHSLSG